MKKITIIVSMFFIVILGGYNAAYALPVSVEYTYTEINAGNYQFDFTVTNNIDPSWGQHIYYFGLGFVSFSQQISGPSGWNWGTNQKTWALTSGETITTNKNYTVNTSYPSYGVPIASGETLSGFSVPFVLDIPTSIDFLVLTSSSYEPRDSDSWFKAYEAGDNNVANISGYNAGFAGNAQLYSPPGGPNDPAPVPEPSTFLLLGGGLAGLVFVARRKRKE